MIVSIVRKRDSNVIFRMIKSIDPYAFVSMSEAQGVYGESFDKMKVSDAKGENRLKRTIIVRAIDDRALVDEAQAVLGDDYDVRSLLDVGCDVTKPFNAQILTENALRRASFVKKYYGFDAFAIDPEDGHIVYVQGDYDAPEYDIHHFNSLEEMKQFLSGKKKA